MPLDPRIILASGQGVEQINPLGTLGEIAKYRDEQEQRRSNRTYRLAQEENLRAQAEQRQQTAEALRKKNERTERYMALYQRPADAGPVTDDEILSTLGPEDGPTIIKANWALQDARLQRFRTHQERLLSLMNGVEVHPTEELQQAAYARSRQQVIEEGLIAEDAIPYLYDPKWVEEKRKQLEKPMTPKEKADADKAIADAKVAAAQAGHMTPEGLTPKEAQEAKDKAAQLTSAEKIAAAGRVSAEKIANIRATDATKTPLTENQKGVIKRWYRAETAKLDKWVKETMPPPTEDEIQAAKDTLVADYRDQMHLDPLPEKPNKVDVPMVVTGTHRFPRATPREDVNLPLPPTPASLQQQMTKLAAQIRTYQRTPAGAALAAEGQQQLARLYTQYRSLTTKR